MATINVTTGTGSATVTVSTGARGPAGQGVPAGGSTGQVLKKTSGTDYDTEWAAEAGGSVSDTAYDATSWSGVTTIAPSKNAVRDKIASLEASLAFGTTTGTYAEGDNLPALSSNAINPNNGIIEITGVTVDYFGNSVASFSGAEDGLENGKGYYAGAEFSLAWSGSEWRLNITNVPPSFTSSEDVETPDLVTTWTAQGSAEGTPTITITAITAAFVGQWCKAVTAWWQWNGTAWVAVYNLDGTQYVPSTTETATEDLADGDLIIYHDVSGTPATKTSVLSRVWTYILAKFAATPLPVNSGGTGATTASAARTNLGVDLAGLQSLLSIQSKTGTSTGLSAVGTTDITGLTGFTLDASTWYKLELHYLWTSTSSNFQINFVTTGTFERGGTTPALGQAMSSVSAVSTAAFVSNTVFQMRGSIGENRTNIPMVGWAYFKTGTIGTGKVQLELLAGTTLSTITSSKAVLTKL